MSTIHSCPACGLCFTFIAELTDHLRNDHVAPDQVESPPWGLLTAALDPARDNSITAKIAAALARQADMALAFVAVPGDGLDAVAVEGLPRTQVDAATTAGVGSAAFHMLRQMTWRSRS